MRTRRQDGSNGSAGSTARTGSNKYNARGQTIENLLQNLQGHFDETLDDETGLTGRYDISLEWQSGDAAASSKAIRDALLNQLGLELVPGRAQVEMLVVRKAE